MTGSKRNGPGWGLTLYFVLVILLAWWPWNFWLLVLGAACYRGLQAWNGFWRGLPSHSRGSIVSRPKQS
jgi:hypothetical protein